MLIASVVLAAVAFSPSHAAATTVRVSVASDGKQGNSAGLNASISANGRYVVFTSWASNLVPGDTNDGSDVFVRDTMAGVTTRVSVASDGTQGNGQSYTPSISANGRYVAFGSDASNLVPGDTNTFRDIFVRDTAIGTTTRVSVASSGTQGNNASSTPSISADGRYVAFASEASNLVPGDTNDYNDIFVRSIVTGTTARVSVASDESQGNSASYTPSISADGRYVAFASFGSNLVPGDTNEQEDVFVRDIVAGKTARVSTASDGTQGDRGSLTPSISADGRYVAFGSYASSLVPSDTNGTHDIFLRDTVTGATTRISMAADGTQGNNESYSPSISAEGRCVAFWSKAPNLIPSDTNGMPDTFVRDTVTGAVTRVSIASNGTQGNLASHTPSISADGRYVAFESYASNLVPGDTNASEDLFLYGRLEIDGPARAREILKIAGGLQSAGLVGLVVCDANGDGKVTVLDAAQLLRE